MSLYRLRVTVASSTATWRRHVTSSFFLTVFAHSFSAFSQDTPFRHFTTEDGLLSNQNTVIEQTASGYMLIGGDNGISRFDGESFVNLAHASNTKGSLPGNTVQDIHVDSTDRIWIGLESGGLVELDENLTVLQHIQSEEEGGPLPGNTIWSLTSDCKNRLLLGFPGQGVTAIDVADMQSSIVQPNSMTHYGVPLDAGNSKRTNALVLFVHTDSNCNVWAGTYQNGLYLLNEATARFAPFNTAVHLENPDSLSEPRSSRILSIASNSDVTFVAEDHYLLIIDQFNQDIIQSYDLREVFAVEASRLRQISMLENDELLLASANGLFQLQFDLQTYAIKRQQHMQSNDVLPDSLSSNNIYEVNSDNQGGIWIGTFASGLNYKPGGWRAIKLLRRNALDQESLGSNLISSMAIKDDILWIGTRNNDDRLTRYDLQNQTYLPLPAYEDINPLDGEHIWAIYPEDNGSVWFADGESIYHYDPVNGYRHTTVADDSKIPTRGKLPFWLGRVNGQLWSILKSSYVMKLDETSNTWHHISPHTNTADGPELVMVDSIQLANNRWLVAADSGIYFYQNDCQCFTLAHDSIDDPVYQMHPTGLRSFWLAKRSGLYHASLQDKQIALGVRVDYPETLQNLPISNLVQTEPDKLWLGTSYGLFRLNMNTGLNAITSYSQYTRSDGLPSAEITPYTLLETSPGQLALGSRAGIVLLRTEALPQQTIAPITQINALRTNKVSVTTDNGVFEDAVAMEYDDRMVNIELGNILFNNRDKLEYQYLLSGWHDDWLTTKPVQQLNLSQLRSGDYQFQVRARILGSSWGPINDSLHFSIAKPPWLSNIAFGLYALTSGLLLMIWHHRRQLAKQRQRKLLVANTKRQAAEQQSSIAIDMARAIEPSAIAAALFAALKQRLPVKALVVSFRYGETDTIELGDVPVLQHDWASQYRDFDQTPEKRSAVFDTEQRNQAYLPLGVNRPLSAMAYIHMGDRYYLRDEDIAFAELVSKMGGYAVNNSKQLQQLTQLAAANQRANQAKSQFISTVSHEIRTPLHGLMGMLQLLEKPGQSDEHELIENLNVSSQQLLSVLDNVLDISKIEANKLELDEHAYAIDKLLSECTLLFTDKAEDKGLSLIALTALNLPGWLIGDSSRLRQVITNLINNAIKFTDAGLISVTATADHDQLVINVSDTGVGMQASTAARMFEDYAQADSTVWQNYGGSGLGLAISQRLVKSMHGKISIESELDKGSVFSIRLPRQEPDIVRDFSPILWPRKLQVGLDCGLLNDPLQTCLSDTLSCIMVNAPEKHIPDGLDVLLTDNQATQQFAEGAGIPSAYVVIGKRLGSDQVIPDEMLAHAFELPKQWQQLTVWLLAHSIQLTTAGSASSSG